VRTDLQHARSAVSTAYTGDEVAWTTRCFRKGFLEPQPPAIDEGAHWVGKFLTVNADLVIIGVARASVVAHIVNGMSGPQPVPRFAPKVPLGWIVQLYRRDALGIQDSELLDKVGARLYARCLDVLAVSDSLVRCPLCQTEFEVPWIGRPAGSTAKCPNCNWSISAGAYHARFEHQDLLGGNARGAFKTFVADYPKVGSYPERMLIIDRLVHAVHVSGNTVVRNLIEGRPSHALATLDKLAARQL
jgi:ribosomal protein L37AE/L43A